MENVEAKIVVCVRSSFWFKSIKLCTFFKSSEKSILFSSLCVLFFLAFWLIVKHFSLSVKPEMYTHMATSIALQLDLSMILTAETTREKNVQKLKGKKWLGPTASIQLTNQRGFLDKKTQRKTNVIWRKWFDRIVCNKNVNYFERWTQFWGKLKKEGAPFTSRNF